MSRLTCPESSRVADASSSWGEWRKLTELSLEQEEDDQPEYDFEEHVSKPKITPGFILPKDDRPLLELAGSVGYDSCKRSNLCVLGYHTLLFAAGSYLRVHQMDTGEDIILRCTGDGSVACLNVNPNHTAIACGEVGNKPDINIFGYPSCKLRKVLKNGTEKEYVSVEFEPMSGNLLAALGGEPDHNLTIWRWRREVPLLRCRSASQELYRVAFSDELFGSLVTSGLGHIRFWTMAVTFTGLKLKGTFGRFGGHEPSNIEAFVQFSDGKVVSGSEEGTMLLWEEALLKAEFTQEKKSFCHKGKITQMLIFEGEILTLGEDGFIKTWSVDDLLYVEPSFHGQRFPLKVLLEIHIGKQSCPMHMAYANPKNPNSFEWYAQDRGGKIWNVDLSISNAKQPKVVLDFHGGPVLACAASYDAHLVATAGQDGTFRVFDCLQKTELLVMKFSAPASSVVWVPLSVDDQGSSVMVGFGDGSIKKIVFCDGGKWEFAQDKTTRKLDGQLSQVFKAHGDRVVSMIFSHENDVFVSGSVDKTIFFFTVKDTEFVPYGWLSLPTAVRQLQWTPSPFEWQGLLAVCDDGIVVQIQENNLFNTTELSDTFQFVNPRFHLFKFQSVKSEMLHAEKKAMLEEKTGQTKDDETEERSEEMDQFIEFMGEKDPLWKEVMNWKPYDPDPPSPILQALYSHEENCFWLTLGGYDAGYIYFCRFPSSYYQEENTSLFLTKPEKAFVVPDCSDVPITVMKIEYTPEEHLALLGFQNGRVRLVQLPPTSKLFDLSTFWELNIHDSKKGSLTGMVFAFDHSYLVTTGMDGNIFIFSYRGLLEMITQTQTTSSTPFTIHHHDICSEDISGDAMGIAERIEHEKQQAAQMKAEALKKERREALKKVRNQFEQLSIQNDQLPVHHRLPRRELLVNVDLQKEDMEKRLEKIAEMKRIYAWEFEKTRLLLQKAVSGFLGHEELPNQFVVKAFKQSIQVKSYRVCRICPGLDKLSTSSKERKESYVHGDIEETAVDSTDLIDPSLDEWKYAYSLTQRHSIGLTGTVARSLKMALDRVFKAKEKQKKRKAEWEQLYEERALVDQDDPQDLMAIENAKQTMGGIKLKEDPEHAVIMARRYSDGSACKYMAELDIDWCNNINAFNEKLFTLREEKCVVLRVFQTLNTYLVQRSGGTKCLPDLPQLSEEEVPEAKLVFDEQTIYRFKKDLEDLSKADPVPLPETMAASQPNDKSRPPLQIKKPAYHHMFYKGECSEAPDIVQLVLKQTAMESDTTVSMGSSSFEEGDSVDQMSKLQKEMSMVSKLQTDLEETLIKRFLSDLEEDFDNKVRDLHRERFELDVYLRQIDLQYLLKLEEFLVNKKTCVVERELKAQATKKEHELTKNNAVCALLKKQTARKNEEAEHFSKQIEDLWLQFNELCASKSGNKIMGFLIRLFKRKQMRKSKGDEYEEDEDMSESESFSSGTDSMSDASSVYDLSYCPEQLEIELYDSVTELQKQRQDYDDQVSAIQQDLFLMGKELEQNAKEAEVLKRADEKIKQQMQSFFMEKIKMINDILAVVLLKISRIYCSVPDGLVLNRVDLKNLQSRVHELKRDIKAQIEIKKEHAWEDVAVRRANRLLHNRIDTWEKKCDEEVVKKFGRPVNLDDLERIVIDPKVEVLKCQLLMARDKQILEEKVLDDEVKDLKRAALDRLTQTTIRYEAKTDVLIKKHRLERRLDLRCNAQKDYREDEPRKQRLRYQERRKLEYLLQQQASVMDKCCGEMTGLLLRGTSRKGKLPPLSKHYSLLSALETRNVAVDVPVRNPNLPSTKRKLLPLSKL